ncbi:MULTISPECIES: hypothetical protein [Paramagnetospirillum]|uniref:Uncharacterized protein n=2 Tax=Paramagnetospirillum TaxID=3031148 RepID=A0A0C2UC30_PARME|nr:MULTISPECIES: hypothetical protein [Paramagnetospirillum]KIL99057.1 hypothetical protein CCC_02507 [Paramagnetospirillum magnetotacticum MS-1]BAE51424.1 hypothetical protein amb2620 [Paramagnetospirillum magneticum AMB-1]
MSTQDLSVTQAVAYSVLYALDIEAAAPWKAWAHIWLKGDDRTAASAQMAAAGASTPSAKSAANAARLAAEATQLQTEAAMLMAENRNASWQLDQYELRNEQCLNSVAESIRMGSSDGTLDTQSPRSAELRAKVQKEF